MTTQDQPEGRAYHLPKPAAHDFASPAVSEYRGEEDGEHFAVVDLGNGGTIWTSDAAMARALAAAFTRAAELLDPQAPDGKVGTRELLALGDDPQAADAPGVSK